MRKTNPTVSPILPVASPFAAAAFTLIPAVGPEPAPSERFP